MKFSFPIFFTILFISNSSFAENTILQSMPMPGGNKTIYIEEKPRLPSTPEEDPSDDLITIIENGKKTLLEESRVNDNDPNNSIGSISDLNLSPDNNYIYFNSSGTTSSSVHKINLESKKDSFVVGGMIVCVVSSGEYKDDLVVSQHRYFVQGGSYDGLFVYSSDGKEIGIASQEDNDETRSRICPKSVL